MFKLSCGGGLGCEPLQVPAVSSLHVKKFMSHNISPPPIPASPPSTGVRRHHTISAASRTARAGARATISEESQDQQLWNDDEPVDEDWVGGVGAVGEKTSLHRQSSLPTNSKRGLPLSPLSLPLSFTPSPISQLSALHQGNPAIRHREL